MKATLVKIGEGAFVDVFGCQNENWDSLAIKVKYNMVQYHQVRLERVFSDLEGFAQMLKLVGV